MRSKLPNVKLFLQAQPGTSLDKRLTNLKVHFNYHTKSLEFRNDSIQDATQKQNVLAFKLVLNTATDKQTRCKQLCQQFW